MDLDYCKAIELMYDLALEPAMRMTEIFTITLDQVDLAGGTVFLTRTKNGHKRQVPLTSVDVRRIEEYLSMVNVAVGRIAGFAVEKGMLLPFSNGDVSMKRRKRTSDRLSQKWGRVFENAGAEQLTLHDLR